VTPKRSFAVALVGCVVGAAMALFAGSRTWQTTLKPRPAPLPPSHVAHTGNSLSPWLLALALVGLAGAGALLATRGALRRVVGALVALAGIGIMVAAARGFAYTPGWPLLALIGGAGVAACGVLAVRFSADWPAMGARYERGARVPKDRPVTEVTMWDDLDHGVDPTERP
jgi:Tryptophan-associated transmembrane protein (Trp_oprn_chp)